MGYEENWETHNYYLFLSIMAILVISQLPQSLVRTLYYRQDWQHCMTSSFFCSHGKSYFYHKVRTFTNRREKATQNYKIFGCTQFLKQIITLERKVFGT